jgi:hypothetical protein
MRINLAITLHSTHRRRVPHARARRRQLPPRNPLHHCRQPFHLLWLPHLRTVAQPQLSVLVRPCNNNTVGRKCQCRRLIPSQHRILSSLQSSPRGPKAPALKRITVRDAPHVRSAPEPVTAMAW